MKFESARSSSSSSSSSSSLSLSLSLSLLIPQKVRTPSDWEHAQYFSDLLSFLTFLTFLSAKEGKEAKDIWKGEGVYPTWGRSSFLQIFYSIL